MALMQREKEQKPRTCICDTYWVDELIEESGHATEPLENGNTLRSDMKGEQFDQES